MSDVPQLYGASEAAKRAGVNYLYFRKYLKIGFIQPTAVCAMGALFSDAGIEAAKQVIALIKAEKELVSKRATPEFLEKIRKLYEENDLTLQQIGVEEGVTRERVRQWLKKLGVSGGKKIARRKVSKSTHKATITEMKREVRAKRMYNCTWDEYKKATGAVYTFLGNTNPLIRAYRNHRTAALRMKIPWELSIGEYREIVTDDLIHFPKWRGNFTLGRIDKNKPYTKDNTMVMTLSENSRITQNQAKADRQRAKVFALRDEGLDHVEIAAKVGIGLDSVTQYLYQRHNKETFDGSGT